MKKQRKDYNKKGCFQSDVLRYQDNAENIQTQKFHSVQIILASFNFKTISGQIIFAENTEVSIRTGKIYSKQAKRQIRNYLIWRLETMFIREAH